MADGEMQVKQVILWEASETYGITALVSREDHDEYVSAIRALTEAERFGPLLSADLPHWAERIVNEQREGLEDEGKSVSEDTPWVFSLHDRDDEAYPCPWDWNHLTEAEWAAEVEDVLLAYGSISGSPGHIDVYRVDDIGGLIGALSERGYELERHDGLVDAYADRVLLCAPNVDKSTQQPSFAIIVGGGKDAPATSGEAASETLGGAVEEALQAVWSGRAGLEILFDRDLTLPEKRLVTEAARRTAEASREGEWEHSPDGELGNRYRINEALGPSFAGRGYEDCDFETLAGVWLDDRAFRILTSEELGERGEEWAAVRHWHPDPHTSGSWGGSLRLSAPGLLCEHIRNDDDGDYYTLLSAPTGAEEAAATIRNFLEQLFLREICYTLDEDTERRVARWLMVLYGLAGENVSSLAPIHAGVLPSGEEILGWGYEIDELRVSPPGEAAAILQRLGAPSSRERKDLQDAIAAYRAALAEYEQEWPDGHSETIAAWRAIEQKLAP